MLAGIEVWVEALNTHLGGKIYKLFCTAIDLKTNEADTWNCGNWSKRVEGVGSNVVAVFLITLPNNADAESLVSNTALPPSHATGLGRQIGRFAWDGEAQVLEDTGQVHEGALEIEATILRYLR